MRLWDLMKASKGIPVSDPMARLWWYQYQQNSEISGVPPLHFTSRVEHLLDYHIYGNAVQDGTPTPETPVEVLGCGEYDSELSYKIPVTVSDGTNSITTPVYLGSEPLHKIRDYADYVDYKRGVVVRRIKKYVFTGEENGTIYSTSTSRKGIEIIGITGIIGGNADIAILAICTHYQPDTRGALYRNTDNGISNAYNNDRIIFYDARCQTVEAFRQFCAQQYANGTPVTVWYVLTEPEEEPLENLLPIQTIRGSDVLTTETTVQPSNIWIKGKIKAIN